MRMLPRPHAELQGRMLGSMGRCGALSFHESKNIVSGEGGALLINRPKDTVPAEIIREKGTNRSSFFRDDVKKYTWVDMGSSYLPGELIAAFLYVQLEQAEAITAERLRLWHRYHAAFAEAEALGVLRRPIVPAHVQHNGHMYYLLLRDSATRDRLIERLKSRGIAAPFHYVPLHSAPCRQTPCAHVGAFAGDRRFGRPPDQVAAMVAHVRGGR